MKQQSEYLAKYLVIWFILSIAVMPVAHCSSASTADDDHAQAWNLLSYQLIEAPAAHALTSWQAWLNRGITATLWSLCLSNSLSASFNDPSKINGTEKFRGLVDDDHIDSIRARRAQAYADLLRTKKKSRFFGICAALSTVWTTYRNRFFLVHTAEQEAFADYLEDFEINKQYLPPDPELIALFEKASCMRKNTPRKFKKLVPTLLKQIKQYLQSPRLLSETT